MAIVTSHYRPKRAPGKKRTPPALASVIVTPAPMKKRLGPVIRLGAEDRSDDTTHPPRPAIVTARHPRRRSFADAPELAPEEYQRRSDGADALFRELVRRARRDRD
jgi:hypothetical protein